MKRRLRNVLLAPLVLVAVLAIVGAGVMATLALYGIQGERADAITRTCNDQNHRHDRTTSTLDRLLLERVLRQRVAPVTSPADVTYRLLAELKRAPSPLRTRLVVSRASTQLLIDALAPRQNCAARVERFVGGR